MGDHMRSSQTNELIAVLHHVLGHYLFFPGELSGASAGSYDSACSCMETGTAAIWLSTAARRSRMAACPC